MIAERPLSRPAPPFPEPEPRLPDGYASPAQIERWLGWAERCERYLTAQRRAEPEVAQVQAELLAAAREAFDFLYDDGETIPDDRSRERWRFDLVRSLGDAIRQCEVMP